MSRIPTVEELERRLEARKKRAANLKARQNDPEQNKIGVNGRQPREIYKYHSVFDNVDYNVVASETAVSWFGITNLGLATQDISKGRAPRGFKPAQVRATLGREAPQKVQSDLSKEYYLKYSQDAAGTARSTYTAPLSASTLDALKTKFQTIKTSKAAELKEYGRLYFIPEQPLLSASGGTASGGTTPTA